LFWKIADLTREVKRRLEIDDLSKKTVDAWFRHLEKMGIHYVNRTVEKNEKVYDELDLEIAMFIRKRREENWPLTKIFGAVAENFPVRPFPVIKESQNSFPSERAGHIKESVLTELKKAMAEVASAQMEELKKEFHGLLTPKENRQETAIAERERLFQEMVLRKRIEYRLEQEALIAWSKKPEEERFVRKGWFRKEEDRDKRELFVKEYVFRHYESRLRKELLS